MTKIAEIQPKGVAKMIVYYDKSVTRNPYKVFLKWKELTPHGLADRSRMIKRYADLSSAATVLSEYAFQHNEEGR